MESERLAIFVVLALLAVSGASAADWPQLGGPHRDGVVEARLPRDGMRLETVWRRSLGSGYSGISVAGGSALTMYADGGSDWLAALDAATGETRWKLALGPTYPGHDGSDDGPLSTPLVHEGLVFAVTPRGELLAAALADGAVQWRFDLTETYGAGVPEYGFATSPIAAAGRIVVQVGGSEGRGLCAFDGATGELAWKIGDEAADYRTPVPLSVGGRTQLVVVTQKTLRGVDPATGRMLWEHTSGKDPWGEVANVAPAGGGRFLVTGWEGSRFYEVVPTDEGFALAERWETSEIKQGYGTPVYRAGLLFGYSGGYLVALDVTSGERVWKSRPPGPGAPILVGSHLVVWAQGGRLHLAPAGREGFDPVAEADVLDTVGLTAPSFADGTFYVRNLSEIAAVAVRAGSAAVALDRGAIPEPTAGSRFGAFLRGLGGAADKKAAIDGLLAGNQRLPLTEKGGLVHFLYRGEAEDVGIVGSMTPHASHSLVRVAGTDLFYRSYRLDPGSRVEYSFIVDFGEPRADPRNPLVAPGSEGARSELLLPGWRVPDYAVEPLGEPRGTFESFEVESAALGGPRTIQVYLPPDYAKGGQRYPLLLVPDIYEAREHGGLPQIVDRRAAAGHPPLVVAYIPFAPGFGFWDEGYGPRRDAMVRFVADELIPALSERFRLRAGRENRAAMGFGWGAMVALYAATTRSDVIAHAATATLLTYGPFNDAFAAVLDGLEGAPPLDVYVGWGTYDHDPDFAEHIDLVETNRALAGILGEHGYHVTTRTILAGTGWGSWWAHVGPALDGFFDEP